MSGIEQAVYQSLGRLNAAELETLCEDLKLPAKDLDGRRGNITLLNKLILRYLTSTEVEDSEDGGTPIFEQIYTYIESCTEMNAKQQQQFLLGDPDPFDMFFFRRSSTLVSPLNKNGMMTMRSSKIYL